MGVYIRGMGMPKNGYDCPLCRNGMCRVADYNSDGICLVYCPDEEHRPSDCPLIEVPPHGRLIDLDETALAQYYDEEHEEWSMKTVTVEDILWEVCENMPPIIIPADKDGET